MDGKRGVATDFHWYEDKRDRYTVKLDGGEAVKARPANVRAKGAGTAITGGAGTGKVKGRGKKPRRWPWRAQVKAKVAG